MQIKIISETYNPLLKRKEVTFEINHTQTGGTPPRFEVRKTLAQIVEADLSRVYVRKIETKTGTMIAIGTANILSLIHI